MERQDDARVEEWIKQNVSMPTRSAKQSKKERNRPPPLLLPSNNIEPIMSSTADATESVPIPPPTPAPNAMPHGPMLMVRPSTAVTTPARATTSAARQAPSPMSIREKLEFEENDVHAFIYQRGDRGDRELIVISNGVRVRVDPRTVHTYRKLRSCK